MFVQFDSSVEPKKIIAVFCGPQNSGVYPFLGEVEESDPLYVAFITPAAPEVIIDPLEKLKAFLLENPDVSAILK